jgi:hypothetical protein
VASDQRGGPARSHLPAELAAHKASDGINDDKAHAALNDNFLQPVEHFLQLRCAAHAAQRTARNRVTLAFLVVLPQTVREWAHEIGRERDCAPVHQAALRQRLLRLKILKKIRERHLRDLAEALSAEARFRV